MATQQNTSGNQNQNQRSTQNKNPAQNQNQNPSQNQNQNPSQNQNQTQNINQTRRLFDEVFNKENLAMCDEIVAPNCKLHDPACNQNGTKTFKEMEAGYAKAFPHKKMKIEDIAASDNKVFVRWSCTGTHKGNLGDISPSNKNVSITGISIYHFNNGKITEVYQNWDRLGLLEQIGEIHPAHAALH